LLISNPGSSGSAWAACQPIAFIIGLPITTPNETNQESAQLGNDFFIILLDQSRDAVRARKTGA
ncbi:MAG: hypothetical protein ACTIKR_16890, partial [Advenella sp.]|uniref:hypothetical protein n=1 Tax=Advenella sp. TaxID=1872388 RepID=UPI003F9D106A